MRVLFVYPDIGGVGHYGARKYYHGIGYISAVLKQAGHAASLIYLTHAPARETFLAQVQAVAPAVVAFSATTHQYPAVEQCAVWLKEEQPDIFLVAGGVHPTLAPETVARSPALDAFCVGEGEMPLLELVERLEKGQDIGDIQNLWVRRPDGWRRNPLRPLIQPLDELPFADRELFDFDAILAANAGWVDMLAGRGCPYRCSYCCNPGLQERYRGLGRYVRYRGVENILAEIEALARRYPVRVLNFQDDVFTLDRRWAIAFCEAYTSRFRFPFWINTRVERILNDEELVRALARAGCAGVRIGLESGNEHMRREILKRGMTNDEIRQAFRLLRRYGLRVYTCNMLGLPGETPEMIEETIALNRELAPDDLQFSVFYPYPMTELYDRVVREGLLKGERTLWGYYSPESVLELPTLTPAQLAEKYERFARLKAELHLRRRHPWRYRLRRAALWLLGGSEERLQRVLDFVRGRKRGKIKGQLERILPKLWTFLFIMTPIGSVWEIGVM
ncbi:MAG: B12-binding domain-containing radical SAM protein [Anaerolineae bacterium]